MMRVFDEWLLLPERMAVHEPTATAVLADLHLGYAQVRRQLGDAIPWQDTDEALRPLGNAVQTHAIRRLIVAGDLFERGFDETAYRAFLDVLDRLGVVWVGLVPGNHDRGVNETSMPVFSAGYDLAGWRIVHGDEPGEAPRTIMGHWHPARRWQGRKCPCFLASDSRLVLPAYSPDAAGVDVRSDPRWRGWQAYAIIDNRVVSDVTV